MLSIASPPSQERCYFLEMPKELHFVVMMNLKVSEVARLIRTCKTMHPRGQEYLRQKMIVHCSYVYDEEHLQKVVMPSAEYYGGIPSSSKIYSLPKDENEILDKLKRCALTSEEIELLLCNNRLYSSNEEFQQLVEYCMRKMQVSKGFKIISRFMNESSPIHLAIAARSKNFIKLLLEDCRATYFSLKMHFFQKNDDLEITQLLIDKGALDTMRFYKPTEDDMKNLALTDAIIGGHFASTQYLLSMGARSDKLQHFNTPLEASIVCGHLPLFQFFWERDHLHFKQDKKLEKLIAMASHPDVLRFLLEKSTTIELDRYLPDLATMFRRTGDEELTFQLNIADTVESRIAYYLPETIKVWIEFGANVNAQGGEARTSLHNFAAWLSSYEALEDERKEDLKAQEDRNPLLRERRDFRTYKDLQYLKCIQILVEKGADLSIMDDENKTVFDLLREKNRTDVIDMIM